MQASQIYVNLLVKCKCFWFLFFNSGFGEMKYGIKASRQ